MRNHHAMAFSTRAAMMAALAKSTGRQKRRPRPKVQTSKGVDWRMPPLNGGTRRG